MGCAPCKGEFKRFRNSLPYEEHLGARKDLGTKQDADERKALPDWQDREHRFWKLSLDPVGFGLSGNEERLVERLVRSSDGRELTIWCSGPGVEIELFSLQESCVLCSMTNRAGQTSDIFGRQADGRSGSGSCHDLQIALKSALKEHPKDGPSQSVKFKFEFVFVKAMLEERKLMAMLQNGDQLDERGAGCIVKEIYLGAEVHGTVFDGQGEPTGSNRVTFTKGPGLVSMQFTYDIFGGPPIGESPLEFEGMNAFYDALLKRWVGVALAHSSEWKPLYVHAEVPPVSLGKMLDGGKGTMNDRIYKEIVRLSHKQANATASGWETVQLAAAKAEFLKRVLKQQLLTVEQAGEVYKVKYNTEFVTSGLQQVVKEHALNLLSIMGPPREGKSTLMNLLIGGIEVDGLDVFPVGNTMKPQTQGADIASWVMPFDCFAQSAIEQEVEPEPISLAFVDVEGLGDKGPQYDVNLYCGIVLFSKVLILNTKSHAKQEFIRYLARIALSVQRISFGGGSAGKGPHLHVVFRDYQFQGGTPDDLKRQWLVEAEGDVEDAKDFNDRLYLAKNFFASIDFWFLPQPTAAHKDDLHKKGRNKLSSDFVCKMSEVRGALVKQLAVPKLFGQAILTGNSFATLLQKTIRSLNDDSEVDTNELISQFAEDKMKQKREERINTFETTVLKALDDGKLTSVNQFEDEWWKENVERIARELDAEEKALTKEAATSQFAKFKDAMEKRKPLLVDLVSRKGAAKKIEFKENLGKKVKNFFPVTKQMLPVPLRDLIGFVRKLEQDIKHDIDEFKLDAREADLLYAELVEDIKKPASKLNAANLTLAADDLRDLMRQTWELDELSQRIHIATEAGVDPSDSSLKDGVQQLKLATKWTEKKRSIESLPIEKQLKEFKHLLAELCPDNFRELARTKKWLAKAQCMKCDGTGETGGFFGFFVANQCSECGGTGVATKDLGLSDHPRGKQLPDVGVLLGPEKDVFKNAGSAMTYWSLARRNLNATMPCHALHVATVLVKQAIKPHEPLKLRNIDLFDEQNVIRSGIKFVAHGLINFRHEGLQLPRQHLGQEALEDLIVRSPIHANDVVCVHDCAGRVFQGNEATDNDPLRKFVLFKFYQGVLWYFIFMYGNRLQNARITVSELRAECLEVQELLKIDRGKVDDLECFSKLEQLSKKLVEELDQRYDQVKDNDIDVKALQSLSNEVGQESYCEQQRKLRENIRQESAQQALLVAVDTIQNFIESLNNRARQFEDANKEFADTFLRCKNQKQDKLSASLPFFDRSPDMLACVVPIVTRPLATCQQTKLSAVMDDDVHRFLNIMSGGPGSMCSVKEFLIVMEHNSFSGSEADAKVLEGLVRDQFMEVLQRSLNNLEHRGGGILCNDVELRAWLFDLLKRRQHFDTMLCLRLRRQSREPGWSVLEHALPRDVTIALTRVCDGDTKKFILPLMQEIGMSIPIYYVWCDMDDIDEMDSSGSWPLQECIDLAALGCCDIETPWVVNIGTSKTRGKTKMLKMLYGMEDASVNATSGLKHLHDTTFIDIIPAWKVGTFKILFTDVHNFSLSKATESGVWRSIGCLSKYNHLIILQVSANDFQDKQISEEVEALMSRILKVSYAKVLCFFRDYETDQNAMVNHIAKWLKDELRERYVGMWKIENIETSLDGFRNAKLNDFLDSQPQDGTPETGSSLRQILTTDLSHMFKAAMKQHSITMHRGAHSTFEQLFRGCQQAQPPKPSERRLLSFKPLSRVNSTVSASSQHQAVSVFDLRRHLTELLSKGSKDKNFSQKLFPFTVRNIQLEAIRKKRISNDRDRLEARMAGIEKNHEKVQDLEEEICRVDVTCTTTRAHDLLLWFGQQVARRDFEKIQDFGSILYEWRMSKKVDVNLAALENLTRERRAAQVKLDIQRQELRSDQLGDLEANIKSLEERYKELRAETDQYNISVDSFWHELMFRSDLRRHDARYVKLRKLDRTDLEFDELIDCYKDYLRLGNSIHFLHGDPLYFGTSIPYDKGNQVAQDFIGSLLGHLDTRIGRRRIVVISVIGIQSSGKSTLMNYIFGCSFATSVGRCTAGMFFSILETDTEVVLVLDTEGLLSVEARTTVFDKRVSLMTIACSDLVIINNRGELSAAVQELFTVCVFALEQMKDLRNADARPKFAFVLQGLTDVSNVNKKKWITDVKDKLVKAVETFKKRDGVSKASLGDLIDLQDDAIFTLPVTAHERSTALGQVRNYNSIYSYLALKLRHDLLQLCHSKPRVAHSLSSWYKHAKQVWDTLESVGEEILHFQDASHIKQVLQLEEEVQKIILRMEEEMRVHCKAINKECEEKLKSCNTRKQVEAEEELAKNKINQHGDLAVINMQESFDSVVQKESVQDPGLRIQYKRKLFYPTQAAKANQLSLLETIVKARHVDLFVQETSDNIFRKVQDSLNQMPGADKDGAKIDETRLDEIVNAIPKRQYWETFSVSATKHDVLQEMELRITSVAGRHKGQKHIASEDLQDFDKIMRPLWTVSSAPEDEVMREISVKDVFEHAPPLKHCDRHFVENPCASVSGVVARIPKSQSQRQEAQDTVAQIFQSKLFQLFENIQAMMKGSQHLEIFDCIPSAYGNTVNTCSDLEHVLQKDHYYFSMRDKSSMFVHRIAVCMFWFIWHRVVYYNFRMHSERKMKAEAVMSTIKKQVSAVYSSGADNAGVAFELAGLFFEVVKTTITKTCADALDKISSDMGVCSLPPDKACRHANQCFNMQDFHACLQYCMDPTKYLKLLFNKDVAKGQKRVMDSEGTAITSRCDMVRKALNRILGAWSNDSKTSSTVGELLVAIQNDKGLLDERVLVMLQECGRAALNDKLKRKQIDGNGKKAFAAGFEQKFDSLVGANSWRGTIETHIKKTFAAWADKKWPGVQGCTHTCPRCGSKCSNCNPDHVRKGTPHVCDMHMFLCMNGWKYEGTNLPVFTHCRDQAGWDNDNITRNDGQRIKAASCKVDWLDKTTNKPPVQNAPEVNYETTHKTEIEQLQTFWAVAKHAIVMIPKCSGMVLKEQEWEARMRKKFKVADWGKEAYNKARIELYSVE